MKKNNLSLEDFIYNHLTVNLMYYFYNIPIIDLNHNIQDLNTQCYYCHDNIKLSGSHSISRSWNNEKKNIYVLNYNGDSYESKLIFFSNQKNDGDQYSEIFKKDIAYYLNLNYYNGFFYNFFVNSVNCFKFHIHSCFYSICGTCDRKHFLSLDKNEYLFHFFENPLTDLLLTRFELYFEYKENLTIKIMKLNYEHSLKNIEQYKMVYQNIYNYKQKIKEVLLQMKKDLNQSLLDNRPHSFIQIFYNHSIYNFNDYVSNPKMYKKVCDILLDHINSFLNDESNIQQIFSRITEEEKEKNHMQLLKYSNRCAEFLKEFQEYQSHHNFSTLNPKLIDIKNLNNKVYGFSKLKINILIPDYSFFTEEDIVYCFVSPENEIKNIISYFISDKNMKILSLIINNCILRKEIRYNYEDVIKTFYLVALFYGHNHMSIYSKDEENMHNISIIRNKLELLITKKITLRKKFKKIFNLFKRYSLL